VAGEVSREVALSLSDGKEQPGSIFMRSCLSRRSRPCKDPAVQVGVRSSECEGKWQRLPQVGCRMRWDLGLSGHMGSQPLGG
jgi:hypothetical protein